MQILGFAQVQPCSDAAGATAAYLVLDREQFYVSSLYVKQRE